MYNPLMWEEDREDAVEEDEVEVNEAEPVEVVPPKATKPEKKKKAKVEVEKDREIGKRQMTPIEIGWGLARGYKWAERELEELKAKMDARGVQRPVTCPKD